MRKNPSSVGAPRELRGAIPFLATPSPALPKVFVLYSLEAISYRRAKRNECTTLPWEEFDALSRYPCSQGVAFPPTRQAALLDYRRYTQPQGKNEEFRLNQKVTYLTPFSGPLPLRLNQSGLTPSAKPKCSIWALRKPRSAPSITLPDSSWPSPKTSDPVTECAFSPNT